MRSNNIAGAIELRRGEIERQTAAQSQYFKITGEIEVTGVGEGIISVDFPVYFVEKPAFSFGPEMGPGQALTATYFPTGNLCVYQWGEQNRDDGTIVYAGATFVYVCTGTPTQAMVLQWHMEGVGLRGPSPVAS